MFRIIGVFARAAAFGIGTSLGRDLYSRVKENSPWADDIDESSKTESSSEKDALNSRIDELEALLAKLKEELGAAK